jgi:hypothetical protein
MTCEKASLGGVGKPVGAESPTMEWGELLTSIDIAGIA